MAMHWDSGLKSSKYYGVMTTYGQYSMEKLAVHLSEVKICLNVNYRKVEAKICLTFQKVSGNSAICHSWR